MSNTPISQEVARQAQLPPLPYTEAIRKRDRDGEWAYSDDQDFANPEKYGWERVYTADQMREYAISSLSAALADKAGEPRLVMTGYQLRAAAELVGGAPAVAPAVTDEQIIEIALTVFGEPEENCLSGKGERDRRVTVDEYPIGEDCITFARALLATQPDTGGQQP